MTPTREQVVHPTQPLVTDPHGVIRFKENKIVSFLAEGRLNELACMDFSVEDREQLAQLIGYSLSGFGTLSYVTDETYERAQVARADLVAQLAEREAEILEQCRLNGMGAERESALASKLEAAEREIAALKEDAERYRWLRENWTSMRAVASSTKLTLFLEDERWAEFDGAVIDAAIDKARKEK